MRWKHPRPLQFDRWGKNEEGHYREWATQYCRTISVCIREDVIQEMVTKAWSVYMRDDIPEKDYNYIIRSMVNHSTIMIHKGKRLPLQVGATDYGEGAPSVEDQVDGLPMLFMGDKGDRLIDVERACVRIVEILDAEVMRRDLEGEKPLLPKVVDGVGMLLLKLEGYTREEICERYGIQRNSDARIYKLISLALRELKINVDQLISPYNDGR